MSQPHPSQGRALRRAALLDNPRLDWARTPAMRRRLVVAMGIILALEVAMLAFSGIYIADLDMNTMISKIVTGLFFVVFALVLVVFAICFGLLKACTRGVEELDPDQLDERQIQDRGEVYAQAYKIGATLVILLLATTAIWSVATDTHPPELAITTAMLLTFQGTLLLPTLVAAWNTPV